MEIAKERRLHTSPPHDGYGVTLTKSLCTANDKTALQQHFPLSAHDLTIRPEPSAPHGAEAQLIAMVLDGVTSEHSRRSYRTGLTAFFDWIPRSGLSSAFTKALVQRYRAKLVSQRLSPATINVRLASIRKLAREMADNQMLDPAVAAAITGVPCVKKHGTRIGKWLGRDEASRLVNAPSGATLSGKRDRAILEDLQQREGRWVLPDMMGKGNRIRTVTLPEGVKARIDLWLNGAGITSGQIFRAVSKKDEAMGRGLADEKAVWRLVMRHAESAGLGRLAPHDLRRTFAKLCRKAGGDLEQIQLILGHASIQTTERYLGTEQAFAHAVNDALSVELDNLGPCRGDSPTRRYPASAHAQNGNKRTCRLSA